MKEILQASASLHLDGQELELVIQELQKAILRETRIGNEFRANQFNRLMKKFLATKVQFHRDWEVFLLNRMEGMVDQSN